MSSPTTPTPYIIKMTPKIASDWLAKNDTNRTVRPLHVATLAADMAGGLWQFTGDPIRRDEAGHVIDGQHRMLAVIASGVTISFLVIDGLSMDVQKVIDSGSKRTMGDVLQLERKVSNSSAVAAIVNASWLYQVNGGLFNNQHLAEKRKATRSELLGWYDAHTSTILTAEVLARRIQASPARFPLSASAVTLFAAAHFDEELAELFTEIVSTGDAPLDNPGRQLREYGIRRSQATNRPPISRVHLTFARAWNRWVAGEKAHKLVSKNRDDDTTRLTINGPQGQPLFPWPPGLLR